MEHPLRAYRTRKGLTGEAFARRAHTTKTAISRVENGYPKISLKLLRKLSAATDGEVPLSAFVEFYDQHSPSYLPPSVPASETEVA